MGVGLKMRGWMAAGAMAAVLGLGVAPVAAGAQSSIAITEPATPLLPVSFGEWKTGGTPIANSQGPSLVNVSKEALEECGPQRSQVADYVRNEGGNVRGIHVEAIQFGDRTGAFSAFTLVERPGMREGKELGAVDAVGDGAVLVMAGSSVVLVAGATGADLAGLKPLVDGLPKVFGSKGVAALLPTLAPAKGLVNGSLRYALGAATYAAQGGVLPAQSLAWDKSAEAVTAQYEDKRGRETLTLLLYPTPTISIRMMKSIEGAVPQMGPKFAAARVRREAEVVMLAEGSFSGDEAQKMLENIHLKQEVSFDRDMAPVFHAEVVKTYSLLTSITMLAGVMMLAAVVLGLFLGGGRAAIRVLQGKPAAMEPEFLSLHLAPQNKAPEFRGGDAGGRR